MPKKKPDWKRAVIRWSEKDKARVRLEMEFEIDWEAIAQQLAAAALKSKHGRASQLHGAIKARIAKSEPVE